MNSIILAALVAASPIIDTASPSARDTFIHVGAVDYKWYMKIQHGVGLVVNPQITYDDCVKAEDAKTATWCVMAVSYNDLRKRAESDTIGYWLREGDTIWVLRKR